MIKGVKKAIEESMGNHMMSCLMVGNVVSSGIYISGKLTIPFELVSGNLKDFVSPGDIVRIIRDDGGQRYYIVEIDGFTPAMKSATVQIEPIVIPAGGATISSIKITGVSR